MGSNPIVASMEEDDRIDDVIRLINGYDSIPVRPAFCRLWRFKFSLSASTFLTILSFVIIYIAVVNGWIPGYRLDPVTASEYTMDAVMRIGIWVWMICFVAFLLTARAFYDWLYGR